MSRDESERIRRQLRPRPGAADRFRTAIERMQAEPGREQASDDVPLCDRLIRVAPPDLVRRPSQERLDRIHRRTLADPAGGRARTSERDAARGRAAERACAQARACRSVPRRVGGRFEDELDPARDLLSVAELERERAPAEVRRLREQNASLNEGLRHAGQDGDRCMAERDCLLVDVRAAADDHDDEAVRRRGKWVLAALRADHDEEQQ